MFTIVLIWLKLEHILMWNISLLINKFYNIILTWSLLTSHNLTVLSSLQVTNVTLEEWKLTELTSASCPQRVWVQPGVRRSHSLAVRSTDPKVNTHLYVYICTRKTSLYSKVIKPRKGVVLADKTWINT